MGKGYAEGPAAEEAERRLEELALGKREVVREVRAAVYGSTDEEPSRHFLGWLGDWVGAVVDEAGPLALRRAAVAHAAQLHRNRGTPAGLALMFAGAQSSANLRSAGHLSGGVTDEDGTWDALFGGRQQHVRNYF